LKKILDSAKQRVKPSANSENFNLIIENLEAKIITIKTRYVLMQQFLCADKLVEEIQNVTPDFDFISFLGIILIIKIINLEPIKITLLYLIN
jgi:hypothetical protein